MLDMNAAAAAKTNRRTPDDHRAMARARAAEAAQQALRAPLQGRTLDTAPSTELSSDERRARMARTSSAFEGL